MKVMMKQRKLRKEREVERDLDQCLMMKTTWILILAVRSQFKARNSAH